MRAREYAAAASTHRLWRMINDQMAVRIADPHDSTSARIDFGIRLTVRTSLASRTLLIQIYWANLGFSLSLHFLAWRVLCSCDTREEQK